MCSSACQSIDSSSSSRVICGTTMFLTMTELPETPAATRSVLNWWLLKRPAMTPDTPFISMIWPSTTVSGWRPSKPRLTSESAPALPCNSTALTLLEPMSRPTSPFLPSFFLNIILSVPGGVKLSSAVESAEARSRAQDPRVRRARRRRVRVHGGVHLSRDCSVALAWERRRLARSTEEGFKAEACADVEDFREKEEAAVRLC